MGTADGQIPFDVQGGHTTGVRVIAGVKGNPTDTERSAEVYSRTHP